MKQASEQLINELIKECTDFIERAQQTALLPKEKLESRPSPKSWNTLECFGHMNLYGDFYLKELDRAINHSKHAAEETFKSGWLGNYSVLSMLPKEDGRVNKPMKTFKYMDPFETQSSPEEIENFITQMNSMIQLLEKSRSVSLNKTKCKLTIKWIKFNLGDTFRFMIYHNKRHLNQVEGIVQ